MRILVTRPEPEATRWCEALAGHRLEALALPLIAIAPMANTAPLRAIWHRLADHQAVMFVSANAVHHFFDARPEGLGWPDGVLAWAPGPGTAHALAARGVPDAARVAPGIDAAQFDSEALWAVAAARLQGPRPVLVLRGGDASGAGNGRDWLVQQLAARGIGFATVEAYRRVPVGLTLAQRALARDALESGGGLWLFSSSEALRHLLAQVGEGPWPHARAVATHPRIAQAVAAAGFGVVCASRPTVEAVVASIESTR